jgi:hypothetical protein
MFLILDFNWLICAAEIVSVSSKHLGLEIQYEKQWQLLLKTLLLQHRQR